MNTTYLAGTIASIGQIAEWVEQFHRDGYLFLQNVLPPDWVAELRADLDRMIVEQDKPLGGTIEIVERMFEGSPANVHLFDMEPIVSFAEALIDGPCHVIHNNSFRSPIGKGIVGWHQDDPPHMRLLHGEPPTNIRLAVTHFTCNYYLTDVTAEHPDGTEVIPGSHMFGAPPPPAIEGTEWEKRIARNIGPAGSVVMFNNQVWHHGGLNTSDRVRAVTQVTYARRIIGHKYYPFMNYQMPEHVYKDANPRLLRLLGFLPHGAYG
jgi:ectoine hydroxylase-related dioxygenase (phytanoyl-CoA dioxygenase family)